MMLYYLHQENIQILWNAIRKYPVLQYSIPSPSAQHQWFQECLRYMQSRIPTQYLYGENGSGIPRDLLNKLNNETIVYMVSNLKAQQQQLGQQLGQHNGSKKSDATQQIQQQFLEKQREFEYMMSPNKPAVNELPSNDKDEPIKDMEKLIQQHIQSRELDIASFPTPAMITPTPIVASTSNTIHILEEMPQTSVLSTSDSFVEAPTRTKKTVTFQPSDTELRLDHIEKELQDLKQMISSIHGMLQDAKPIHQEGDLETVPSSQS